MRTWVHLKDAILLLNLTKQSWIHLFTSHWRLEWVSLSEPTRENTEKHTWFSLWRHSALQAPPFQSFLSELPVVFQAPPHILKPSNSHRHLLYSLTPSSPHVIRDTHTHSLTSTRSHTQGSHTNLATQARPRNLIKPSCCFEPVLCSSAPCLHSSRQSHTFTHTHPHLLTRTHKDTKPLIITHLWYFPLHHAFTCSTSPISSDLLIYSTFFHSPGWQFYHYRSVFITDHNMSQLLGFHIHSHIHS